MKIQLVALFMILITLFQGYYSVKVCISLNIYKISFYIISFISHLQDFKQEIIQMNGQYIQVKASYKVYVKQVDIVMEGGAQAPDKSKPNTYDQQLQKTLGRSMKNMIKQNWKIFKKFCKNDIKNVAKETYKYYAADRKVRRDYMVIRGKIDNIVNIHHWTYQATKYFDPDNMELIKNAAD